MFGVNGGAGHGRGTRGQNWVSLASPVGAPGLQETRWVRRACRPGALTGRLATPHARRLALPDEE
jgi:hypothetical protein